MLAALLGEWDPLRQDAIGADLCLRLDLLEQRAERVRYTHPSAGAQLRQLRLPKSVPLPPEGWAAGGDCVGLGHPDRFGCRGSGAPWRDGVEPGRGAALNPGSPGR